MAISHNPTLSAAVVSLCCLTEWWFEPCPCKRWNNGMLVRWSCWLTHLHYAKHGHIKIFWWPLNLSHQFWCFDMASCNTALNMNARNVTCMCSDSPLRFNLPPWLHGCLVPRRGQYVPFRNVFISVIVLRAVEIPCCTARVYVLIQTHSWATAMSIRRYSWRQPVGK